MKGVCRNGCGVTVVATFLPRTQELSGSGVGACVK